MSFLVFILSRLYRQLLSLYPSQYWTEYGEEQLEVFDLAVQEAGEKGSGHALYRALREIRDLAGVFIRIHLGCGEFAMAVQLLPQSSSRTTQTPWGIALLSLVPFLFVGPVSVIVSYHPWWDPVGSPWLNPLFIVGSSLLICTGFILGMVQKFPRWSYPYATYLVILITFAVTYQINGTPWDINHESTILFLVVVLFILVTRLLPTFRPFYTNLRLDWTQLSYGLYACTLFILTFHDHDTAPHLNLLVMLPSLIGILGALAHLRMATAFRRVAVLMLSLLLGLFFWSIPVFDGMMGSLDSLLQVLSLLLILWGILAALLLLPILFSLFTHPKQAA